MLDIHVLTIRQIMGIRPPEILFHKLFNLEVSTSIYSTVAKSNLFVDFYVFISLKITRCLVPYPVQQFNQNHKSQFLTNRLR